MPIMPAPYGFRDLQGIQTSLNELCTLVLRLTGSSLKPEHREPRSVANVQRRRAAVEKAEQALGFRATVPLEQGLAELIRWRKAIKAMPSAVGVGQ